jgi:hypothetical protein
VTPNERVATGANEMEAPEELEVVEGLREVVVIRN